MRENKQERLDYLLSKREHLESTGRLITYKQAQEIAKLRAEIGNKTVSDEGFKTD